MDANILRSDIEKQVEQYSALRHEHSSSQACSNKNDSRIASDKYLILTIQYYFLVLKDKTTFAMYWYSV